MSLKSILSLYLLTFISINLQAQTTYEVKYEFKDILTPTMEAVFNMSSLGPEYLDAYEKIIKHYTLKTDAHQSHFFLVSRDLSMIDTNKVKFRFESSPNFYAHIDHKTGYSLNKDGTYKKKEYPNDEWEVVKGESREILGYTCKKAIAYDEFDEVSTIWFTDEINSTCGPFLYTYPQALILVLETPVFKIQATCISKSDEVISPPINLADKQRKKRK